MAEQKGFDFDIPKAPTLVPVKGGEVTIHDPNRKKAQREQREKRPKTKEEYIEKQKQASDNSQ